MTQRMPLRLAGVIELRIYCLRFCDHCSTAEQMQQMQAIYTVTSRDVFCIFIGFDSLLLRCLPPGTQGYE